MEGSVHCLPVKNGTKVNKQVGPTLESNSKVHDTSWDKLTIKLKRDCLVFNCDCLTEHIGE